MAKPVEVYESPQGNGDMVLTVTCADGHKRFEESVQLSPAQQKKPDFVESWREHLRQVYRDHRGQMH